MTKKFFIIPGFLFCMSLAFVNSAFAQTSTVNPKDADLKFINGNYEEALSDYLILHKQDARSEEYNYRIGICYLNTSINKVKAIPYIENVTKRERYDNNALYLLGRAYQYAYRFDDAIRAYNRFKDVGNGTAENLKDAEKQIQYCFNAKELIKYPVEVSFQNLGKNINSPYDDYYPFVSADETVMIFNSKRAEGDAIQKPDGSYSPSAFKSKIKEGYFSKTKNISEELDIPDGDEEVIGLSPDGNTLLMYHDDFKGAYNIYMLKADSGKVYKNPVKLSESVNSKNHEIAACINNEGDVLYFASDRSGGLGGTDIYITRRLPSGAWGIPQNVGEPVNSPSNEDFPNLSPDGKTLYFSSNGHTSMGGYDIFKVGWDEKSSRWVNRKNLGYPVNTPADNMNFCVSANGRYGYISASRAGGYGDLDIYRVTFPNVEHNYIVIKGLIAPADNTSTPAFSYKKITIKVVDNSKKEVFGNYQANPLTGRYIVIVPPGSYNITMSNDGYLTQETTIKIADKIITESEINKDFFLSPDPKWVAPVSVTSVADSTARLTKDSTQVVPILPVDSTLRGK